MQASAFPFFKRNAPGVPLLAGPDRHRLHRPAADRARPRFRRPQPHRQTRGPRASGAGRYSLLSALEAIAGAGLEVPIISTALTTLADPTAGEILGLAGVIGVPFFRPGPWRFNAPAAALLREIADLAAAGRSTKMAMGIQNTNDPAGATVANVTRTIASWTRAG